MSDNEHSTGHTLPAGTAILIFLPSFPLIFPEYNQWLKFLTIFYIRADRTMTGVAAIRHGIPSYSGLQISTVFSVYQIN